MTDTDTGRVTLEGLLAQAAEAAEGRNGAPAAMAVKMHRLITEAWAGGRADAGVLTAKDQALIGNARAISPFLRASASDRDRLAGWLLAELAGRLAGDSAG